MKGSAFAIVAAVTGLSSQFTSAVALPFTPRASAHLALNRTAPHYQNNQAEYIGSEDSSGPVYYIAWFFPPSGSIITNFVSTMSVPKLSPNPNIGVSTLPGFHTSLSTHLDDL